MSPLARGLIATILLGFSGLWGTAIVRQKDPLTWVDAVMTMVPLILGVAAAIPATITFVVTTVKPILPSWGRHDAA